MKRLNVLLVVILLTVFFSFDAQSAYGDSSVVYIVPFEGEVEAGLVNFLQRAFREASMEQAEHIIIEMDTPGGRVDAALEIVELFLNSEIPVTLLVTGTAASAGAIISLSADRVFMEKGTTIGFSAPVMLGGGEQSETMEEKTLSYVLAEVRSICERRGYSEFKTRLAEAMVDKDIEIRDPEKPDEYVIREGKLLGLTSQEAERLKFVDQEVNDREEVLRILGQDTAAVVFVEEYLAEKVARFFTSTAIAGLLITIGMLGLFIEFRTPGFGLPGIVGIAALLLFFWGHTIAGLAGWEGSLLFILGVILLAVELFVIPGFGVVGMAGILGILASIIITLMDKSITSPHFFGTFQWSALLFALTVTTVAIFTGTMGALSVPLMFPFMKRRGYGQWLVLEERQERTKGFSSASETLQLLLGAKGLSTTTLRPSGIAEINGKRVDVVSDGGYIQAHTPVEVVRVEGGKVVVRAL